MALFKSKDKSDSGGQAAEQTPPPDQNPEQTAEEPKYVTVEQFTALQNTIGGLAEGVKALNSQTAYQAQPTPAQAPEDPLKGVKEEISTIDNQLDKLEEKIDNAVYEGKGAGSLMSQQRKLMAQRTDLQLKLHQPTADPRIDAGMQTIDTLSNEVLAAKMPYLSLEKVKERYDYYINQLPVDQRMNPATKQGCYNLAVGENYEAIEETRKQEWMRDQSDQQTQVGGGNGNRDMSSQSSSVTPPEEHFSPEALQTIKNSKHRTPENYVRSLGYADWDDYIEKTTIEEE